MKHLGRGLVVAGVLGLTQVLAPVVLAQGTQAGKPAAVKLPDVLGGIGVFGLVNRVVTTFLGLVGAIALIVFVYAGVLYMISSDEKGVTKAKAAMSTATIGILIILFAYVITQTFLKVFMTG